MPTNTIATYIKDVLENMPKDWLQLTTHRLDIYNEKLAKVEFLEGFENLFKNNNSTKKALKELPTAYDYIRLGHPLSCVLEWSIAKLNHKNPEHIIGFDSNNIPILAILRKNTLESKKTRILFTNKLPNNFNLETVKKVYNYNFEILKIENTSEINDFKGTTIFISEENKVITTEISKNIDFYIQNYGNLGSVLIVNNLEYDSYIADIQHVRRRETIAITPENCLVALDSLITNTAFKIKKNNTKENKVSVLKTIQKITQTTAKPLIASSGLSMQYAIMMGLINNANKHYHGKNIKFIVPPNCYGGTNDQARRVATCIDNVAIVDLPVDGKNDMVSSLENVLNIVGLEDAVPFIIAEIPTNPRVEVPNLIALEATLSKKRKTKSGENAIAPVFILDQTFCPNYLFLGEGEILSTIKAISYASGSKFPSGGKCTAGYCVANSKAENLLTEIENHLDLCGNEATDFQYEILAAQMPNMNERIFNAYKNTREFVTYIQHVLPNAKINFVSEELAKQGFTPSVFSLDLPTKGNSAEEKEMYKRNLNLRLINLMISKIPNESKFCVSYGQLKGCYWTIPATSTQGTTKEGDKDYIVRTSLSANLDLELHKKVFLEFVESI